MRTEERIEIAKAKENYWKEFREAKEEDKEMKDDERQAWRNVKMGIDTFEEDGKRKSTSRGTLSGSSGEDKEDGSRSVSQEDDFIINNERGRNRDQEETYTRRQEEEDQPGAGCSVTRKQRDYKPEN